MCMSLYGVRESYVKLKQKLSGGILCRPTGFVFNFNFFLNLLFHRYIMTCMFRTHLRHRDFVWTKFGPSLVKIEGFKVDKVGSRKKCVQSLWALTTRRRRGGRRRNNKKSEQKQCLFRCKAEKPKT